MGINELPPTIYVAIGTLLASLIAGVFSYLNMIASKENKVSEFRLAWIDGLRHEISEYNSGAQNLGVLIESYNENEETIESDHESVLKWLSAMAEERKRAIESLTKIRLRLNHKELDTNEESFESKLLHSIMKARENLNENNFNEMLKDFEKIRENAAPILKMSWETVKKGEPSYIKIKRRTERTLLLVLILVIGTTGYQVYNGHQRSKLQKENVEMLLNEVNALKNNHHGD